MGSQHTHRLDEAPTAAPTGLTRNETLVWDTLSVGEEPLKAYEILDQLKDKGVRAPMTVYRALEGLEEKGFIHKLEGLNSFVVCNHEGPHEVEVFLVCEQCASAEEIEIDGVESCVTPVLKRAGFSMKTARLEIRGHCLACAQQ
jgi:Fur family zinc uptake transcriptional regulator